MTSDIRANGSWVGHCSTCNSYIDIPSHIGRHTPECCGTEFVVQPPRSYRNGFRTSCKACDSVGEYSAIDLRPSDDGTKTVGSYRCDEGHEWESVWIESPAGRPLTFRKLRCAVYRHFDADRILLYVGISMRPVDRGKAHASVADWTEFAAVVEGVWYAARAEAEAAELDAIRTELPVFNRKHAVGDQKQREADYLLRHEMPLSTFDSPIGATA